MMPPVALSFLYAIAIGSNRGGRGAATPRAMVALALEALDQGDLSLLDASPLIDSAPQGPRARRYANCAALVASRLAPDALLDQLHGIEADLGRTRRLHWGPRCIDLDLILWSEGSFASGGVIVPHPGFRSRAFVLEPLKCIAPEWHDPVTGLSIRQLAARQSRAKPVDRSAAPH
jgi:2-amino-4-hydroxy-6-hydroxymethyldihydropteridine diphosphokinase